MPKVDWLRKLRELSDYRSRTEMNIVKAVWYARRDGISWARIGQALGVSRQSAQERYQKLVEEVVDGA